MTAITRPSVDRLGGRPLSKNASVSRLRTFAERRADATPPLPTCSAWCKEHTHEICADYTEGSGHEVWDQHYRLLAAHDWPLYKDNDPTLGVRTLAVEQSGFDGRYYRSEAVLTLFPGRDEPAGQSLDVRQLRELIEAAQQTIEILEGSQR
jgi:hypothetical protein